MDPLNLRLKQARERAGLSLDQVASRIQGGMDRSALSRWENGLRQPSLDQWASWAAALDLELTCWLEPLERPDSLVLTEDQAAAVSTLRSLVARMDPAGVDALLHMARALLRHPEAR